MILTLWPYREEDRGSSERRKVNTYKSPNIVSAVTALRTLR